MKQKALRRRPGFGFGWWVVILIGRPGWKLPPKLPARVSDSTRLTRYDLVHRVQHGTRRPPRLVEGFGWRRGVGGAAAGDGGGGGAEPLEVVGAVRLWLWLWCG